MTLRSVPMTFLSASVLLIACTRDKPPEVELYMMSKCPFASRAATELGQAISALKHDVRVSVSHIGETAPEGAFSSLRGADEVQGDLLQVCADSLARKQQGVEFLACQAGQFDTLPAGWERCAESAGLDVAAMRACAEGAQGRELLAASFERAGGAGVEQSPTLHIAGKKYEGARNRYALAQALCGAFEDNRPDACASLPEPTEVALRVVTDARCGNACDLTPLRRLLAEEVPGATLTEVAWGSEEGQKLYEQTGGGPLPLVLFPPEWKPDGLLGKSIAPRLKPTEDKQFLFMTVGDGFDPRAEICTNELDDDQDGALDCADSQCRYALECLEEIPRRLDILILMQDEFSHRGVEAAHFALEKLDFELALHPIGHTSKGGIVATGGKEDALEGARLLCAQAQGLAGDDLAQYALCRHQRKGDPNWQGCLPMGFDREAVEACTTSEQGAGLLAESYLASEQLGVKRAPHVLVNHKFPLAGHSPDDLVEGLCAHNEGLQGCPEKDSP